MADELPVDRRRAAFASLTARQDGGATVAASRAAVAEEFAITVLQVREIEREGIAESWPPLDA